MKRSVNDVFMASLNGSAHIYGERCRSNGGSSTRDRDSRSSIRRMHCRRSSWCSRRRKRCYHLLLRWLLLLLHRIIRQRRKWMMEHSWKSSSRCQHGIGNHAPKTSIPCRGSSSLVLLRVGHGEPVGHHLSMDGIGGIGYSLR